MSVSMSSLHESCPLLSVFSTLPDADPSLVGNVYVTPPRDTVDANTAAPFSVVVPSTTNVPEEARVADACMMDPVIVSDRTNIVPSSTIPSPASYVVSVSVEANVIVSVDSSVVIVTFVPATRVKLSVRLSVTMLSCPATTNVEKRF